MNSILSVLSDGFRIYFTHIGKFTKYMAFPVFGQIAGIIWIFAFATWLQSTGWSYALVILAITTVLGLVLLCKALWDYMVAYGALNSMTEAIMTSKKLYDLDAHTKVITQRAFKYVLLLIVISLLFLVAMNPFFMVLGLIFFIYFILVFQVFTFEKDISVSECFKKSLSLIKGNFAYTFSIATALGLICYILLPWGINYLLDLTRLNEFFKSFFELWTTTLPLAKLNYLLEYLHFNVNITSLDVANMVLNSFVTFIMAGLTLPLRSVSWTLWYKKLSEVTKK